MIYQLGLPAMFETFSYAEHYWDDLRQVLANFEPKLKDNNLPKEQFLAVLSKKFEFSDISSEILS